MKLALDSSTVEGFIQVEVNSYNGIAHWWSPFSYFRGTETYNGLYLNGRVHFENWKWTLKIDNGLDRFGRVDNANLGVMKHNGLYLNGRVHFGNGGGSKLANSSWTSPFHNFRGDKWCNGLYLSGAVHLGKGGGDWIPKIDNGLGGVGRVDIIY